MSGQDLPATGLPRVALRRGGMRTLLILAWMGENPSVSFAVIVALGTALGLLGLYAFDWLPRASDRALFESR